MAGKADQNAGSVTPMNRDRLADIKCFLLDMDGTFYLGNQLLPGAMEFIELLRARQVDFLFLTNNSSRSRTEYVQKLARFGLELPENQVFTSGEATTIYLGQTQPGARVFLVGTPALEREFERSGFVLTESDPDVAVLGFDTTLTYAKLWKLCDLVSAGLPYIATHPDINCPTESGFMPDIGAMIELIATSTGRRPDLVVGKPYKPIVEALVQKTGLEPNAIAMVGDRLYTDIALGRHGVTTVLVLSGETSAEDAAESEFKPDYTMQHLAELAAVLRDALARST